MTTTSLRATARRYLCYGIVADLTRAVQPTPGDMVSPLSAKNHEPPSAVGFNLNAFHLRLKLANHWSFGGLRGRLTEIAGGPARLHVIAVLAGVFALESADVAAVGAVATELESSLHVSLVQIGLLVTASSLVAALTTLPFGVLVDRFNRTKLLRVSVFTWSGAMILSGFAQSFLMLLLTRVILGAVTASAGPTVASLTGDYFPENERAKIYGYILTGQLVGTGFGFLIAGNIASAFGWRSAFFALAVPSFVLAGAIAWFLVEPARTGKGQLEPGAPQIISAEDSEEIAATDGESETPRVDEVVVEAIRRDHIEPDPRLILHSDPVTMPIGEAVRFIFRIRTNVLLIVASSLGYFFLAGVQTFALVFVGGRFDLSQSTATSLVPVLGIGAVAGTLLGGRIADRLLLRGNINARILVGAFAYIAAVFVGIPSLIFASLIITIPFFVLAAAGVSAANPPLDAARLDIMPARLWGRAEGVRTVVRTLSTAAAPLLFGFIADQFGASRLVRVSSSYAAVSAAGARGLDYTFLIMLVPLFVSGIIVLAATRTYPVDVASAAASEGWFDEQGDM